LSLDLARIKRRVAGQNFSGQRYWVAIYLAGFGLWQDTQSGLAHTGAPPAPHDLWQAWNWDPGLIAALLLTVCLYGRGVMALWQRAGVGRGIHWRQIGLFVLGLVALGIALLSPLDALSTALFSAHMVQHMLLLYVAPLLLLVGAPPVLFVWALPRPWRRPVMGWWRQSWWHCLWQRLGIWLLHPMVIWGLFGLVLWLWHAPLFYQAAVENRALHRLEHGSFFCTAWLFSWLLVQTWRDKTPTSALVLLIIFTTALHSGMLGALLTFATTPLYPIYRVGVAQWGLTLIEDQQLAGVIMWIPVGFFYLVALLLLVARWLQKMEERGR
jgi:putative membrane protein